MIIIEDKGQQADKHILKHQYFGKYGIEIRAAPLPVGDYILADEKVLDVIRRKEKRGLPVKKMDFLGSYTISVDTKKDMQEIVGNVCGKQHARFRDECILAHNNGIKLYILTENNEGINCIQDVLNWNNPRLRHSLKATQGRTLAKAMETMQEKYGVQFEFCSPYYSGNRVMELLRK